MKIDKMLKRIAAAVLVVGIRLVWHFAIPLEVVLLDTIQT